MTTTQQTSNRARSAGRVGSRLAALVPLMMLSAVAGCASYSEQLVDADGRERSCQMSGWGGIAMRQAKEGVAICREALTSIGYLDPARVGSTGITGLRREPGYLSIDRVEPGSPAARQGVVAGDALLSVDGRRQYYVGDAQLGLFGAAGEPIRVEIMQGDIVRILMLEREPLDVIAARARDQVRATAGEPVVDAVPSVEATPAAVVAVPVEGAAVEGSGVTAPGPAAPTTETSAVPNKEPQRDGTE